MAYVVVGIVLVLGVVFGVLAARRKLGGFHAGDFVKVEIPRTLQKPLAMGTRLDIAASLKKSGVDPAQLRPLLDGTHDQELLDRYWMINT